MMHICALMFIWALSRRRGEGGTTGPAGSSVMLIE